MITAKLDRMFRSVLGALDFGGDGTENGMSKLVFTGFSAVAEVERDRIRGHVVG